MLARAGEAIARVRLLLSSDERNTYSMYTYEIVKIRPQLTYVIENIFKIFFIYIRTLFQVIIYIFR